MRGSKPIILILEIGCAVLTACALMIHLHYHAVKENAHRVVAEAKAVLVALPVPEPAPGITQREPVSRKPISTILDQAGILVSSRERVTYARGKSLERMTLTIPRRSLPPLAATLAQSSDPIRSLSIGPASTDSQALAVTLAVTAADPVPDADEDRARKRFFEALARLSRHVAPLGHRPTVTNSAQAGPPQSVEQVPVGTIVIAGEEMRVSRNSHTGAIRIQKEEVVCSEREGLLCSR